MAVAVGVDGGGLGEAVGLGRKATVAAAEAGPVRALRPERGWVQPCQPPHPTKPNPQSIKTSPKADLVFIGRRLNGD